MPEAQVDDKEKSNLTVPVKEEEIIRQIVVKKGDTLHDIIAQTYGAYDDVILNEVQRQNPKIIDPDLILEDQVIKLPAEPDSAVGQVRGIRSRLDRRRAHGSRI